MVLSAADRVGGRAGAVDAQPGVGEQVADQLVGGLRIHVIDPQFFDAHEAVKADGLELALRAVADQGHAAAVGPGQVLGGQHRGGGRAQRRGQRQFRQDARVAGVHVGQHAKCRDGQQAVAGVLRVAVDVFEGVLAAIGNRHQLDHADWRVAGHAGRLVELRPAPEILANHAHQFADGTFGAGCRQVLLQIIRTNKSNHHFLSLLGKPAGYGHFCRGPAWRVAIHNLRSDGWKFDFLLMRVYDDLRNKIS